MNTSNVDWRRVGMYLVIAFGFTWGIDAIIWFNGGLADSPQLLPGISLALGLIVVSMFGPALAHVVTRLVTREGWQNLWLRPNLRHGWRLWALVWLLTPAFIGVGSALYFSIFPQHFDPSLASLKAQLEALGGEALEAIPVPLQTLFALQVFQGIIIAPFINVLPILGEEFGWRAYLQPKLLPLGERWMYLVTGVIWGLWHAPIILMGYNYGVSYPGVPWAGVLMMIWFTIVLGTFLGWATLRAGSVWPAVIGHGLINGVGPAVGYLVQGQPNTLLGPMTTGVIGSAGFALAALVIWWRARGARTEAEVLATVSVPQGSVVEPA